MWLMEMSLEVALNASVVAFLMYQGFQDPELWFIKTII